MHQNEHTIHLCAAACGSNTKLAGLHENGENEHRTQSGEHGSTRESKHLCRRHAHTGNRGGAAGARGRETQDSYIQVTPRARLPHFPSLECGTLCRQFIRRVRGSVARARVSDLQPKKASESESGVDRAANRSRLGQFAWAVVCWRSTGAYGMTDVGFADGSRVQLSCDRLGSYISSLK